MTPKPLHQEICRIHACYAVTLLLRIVSDRKSEKSSIKIRIGGIARNLSFLESARRRSARLGKQFKIACLAARVALSLRITEDLNQWVALASAGERVQLATESHRPGWLMQRAESVVM